MTASWPSDVPQTALFDGRQWAPQDNVDRAGNDSGPPTSQLKSIVETEIITFSQWLTPAQFESLKAWRRDTLAQGALPFTRQHPDYSSITDPFVCTFVFAPDGFHIAGRSAEKRLVQLTLMRVV